MNMTSRFLIINILLLLSSSLLQARFRAHSKRRIPMPSQTFVRSFPSDDNNIYPDADELHGSNNEESSMDTVKETTTTTTSSTVAQYQANEKQIEQFTRLLIERLNLKEAPNVTVNVNDDTGFPSSIFKQLEPHSQEQRTHENDENNSHRLQKSSR